MRKPAVLAATSGLLALIITPCAARAATPTACQLLNSQSAASLLGTPANPPVDLQGIACSYSGKAGSGTVTFSINDASMSVGDFTMMMKTQGGMGGTMETISGLGDQNFFFIKAGNQNTFMVLNHGKMLALSAQMKMTPALKTSMIQTMKQILTKL